MSRAGLGLRLGRGYERRVLPVLPAREALARRGRVSHLGRQPRRARRTAPPHGRGRQTHAALSCDDRRPLPLAPARPVAQRRAVRADPALLGRRRPHRPHRRPPRRPPSRLVGRHRRRLLLPVPSAASIVPHGDAADLHAAAGALPLHHLRHPPPGTAGSGQPSAVSRGDRHGGRRPLRTHRSSLISHRSSLFTHHSLLRPALRLGPARLGRTHPRERPVVSRAVCDRRRPAVRVRPPAGRPLRIDSPAGARLHRRLGVAKPPTPRSLHPLHQRWAELPPREQRQLRQ